VLAALVNREAIHYDPQPRGLLEPAMPFANTIAKRIAFSISIRAAGSNH